MRLASTVVGELGLGQGAKQVGGNEVRKKKGEEFGYAQLSL